MKCLIIPTTMISPALISLIRTTAPSGLWFNSCNVAQRVYMFKWKGKQNSYVEIQMASINGVWGFSTSLCCKLSGQGSGLWTGDFKHPSFEKCLELATAKVKGYFGGSGIKPELPTSLDDFTIEEPYAYLHNIVGFNSIGI